MPKSSMKQPQDYNTMTLTGNGKVTVVPDIAIIRLGVQTTGENLEEIQSENAQISQAILDSLNQMGIQDIKTYQYTINKQYDYVNGTQIDKGYMVKNIFEIKTDQVQLAGSIIDTAVANGANTVDFVSFEVSEVDMYYRQALNLAVLNAYEKAESIAMNLGVPFNPIPLSIVENSSRPVPVPLNYSLREIAAVTPVQPGNKDIEALVTAEFMY